MQLTTVPFEMLAGLHPKLSEQTKKTSQLMYSATIADFSVDSLETLLGLYPIHVVQQKDEANYWVIAGLRQFELLSVFHAKNAASETVAKADQLASIPVVVHDKSTTKHIQQLAAIDVAGSAILFSLGTKVAAQLDLIRENLPEEIVHQFPKFSSARRLSDRKSRKD
ncbi:hypothetical protein ACFO3I_03245 [Rheinheimera marina]|uniref:Uncharacterized protein n=1 Tax=Rheinheimera marina TaxID=1774958 RepID=A0ABV9JJ37_9GAMM